MKVIHRIISTASIAAVTVASAAPAVAYFKAGSELQPKRAERVEDSAAVPAFGPFAQDAGSGFRTNRAVTSRKIRGNRNMNRPQRVEVRGGERGKAVTDFTRKYQPTRGVWQNPGRRNRRRQYAPNGGEYRRGRIDRAKQGDYRRRPRGYTGTRIIPRRVVPGSNEAALPPALVTTGADKSYPNYRRWARGDRDLNGVNRYDYSMR